MSLLLVGLMAWTAQTMAAPATQAPVADPEGTAGATQAGDDSGPPQTPAEKIAAAAYREYNRALLRSLRASGNARDRALATQMWFLEDAPDVHEPTPSERAARGASLRKAAEAAPDDVLVQWFWANADAEDSGCNAGDPCPHRAEALVRLQPDNGSAWLPVFNAAWKAKDAPAAESVLAQMARATRFDEPFGDAIKAWMEVCRHYPIPSAVVVAGSAEARLDDESRNFPSAMGFAAAVTLPSYDSLMRSCSHAMHPEASQQRFRDCARIGRLMLTHATTLLGSRIGRGILRVSGQATSADRANARVADWQYQQYVALVQNENDGVGKATMTDWLETGDELQVIQHRLQRAGIPLTPPASWQPRGRDGQPIDPLGEASAPAKQL